MSEQSVIVDTLNAVQPGAPRSRRNLTVYPLLVMEPHAPEYLTLDEGLAQGGVDITEVSEHGSVPELRLKNRGDRPVLLLDGEELIGAKQNRVLNLTILVAAQAEMVIPVSCVEAGRWRRKSAAFDAAPRTQFAEGRARKMRDVTDSMLRMGTRESDQGDVWRAIEEKSSRLGARSDTGAMAAMFEQRTSDIEDFVGSLAGEDERQAGAVFVVNGRVVGLELFDAPATWHKVAHKLLRSYAVDAIDRTTWEADEPSVPVLGVAEFLAGVAASQASVFPATGEGSDVRLSSAGITGAALVAGGRAVHVSAFAQ